MGGVILSVLLLALFQKDVPMNPFLENWHRGCLELLVDRTFF